MKPTTLAKAIKLGAKSKACGWYCRQAEIHDPDFSSGRINPQVVEQQGRAWAWADENWVTSLAEVDDEESRFLIGLLTRVQGYLCISTGLVRLAGKPTAMIQAKIRTRLVLGRTAIPNKKSGSRESIKGRVAAQRISSSGMEILSVASPAADLVRLPLQACGETVVAWPVLKTPFPNSTPRRARIRML